MLIALMKCQELDVLNSLKLVMVTHMPPKHTVRVTIGYAWAIGLKLRL